MAIHYDDEYINRWRKPKGKCVECGKDLPSRRRLYCSDKCRSVFVTKHVKVWQWYREEIFDRDNWNCVECGVKVHLGSKPLETRAECDHIIAVSHGGEFWDKSNLRTLCYKCHKKKTKIDVHHNAKHYKLIREGVQQQFVK